MNAIAVVFAARHPDRVAAVLIHGIPYYTADERAARAASKAAPRELASDGSHLTNGFKSALAGLSDSPDGASKTAENLRTATWAAMNRYILAADSGREAVITYDLEPALKKIKVPTLVLTDTQDSLHDMDLRTVKLRPDFAFTEFSKGSLLSLISDPKRWAGIALDFARSKAGK